MFTLLIILLALALIIVSIIKFDIHPFLALFVGAIIYGLLVGMPGDLILKSISEGFGGVLGSIGLLILLGVMIGTFLEKTGGAFVIAQKILAAIGEKSVMLAMMVTGYILSIPVFGDSAFIMMNPINKSLSFKGKLPYAATTVALTLGISASHSLVPPTPGPIAAAGILNADLGMVIFWGIIVSSLALVPCYFFVKYFTRHIDLVPHFAEVESEVQHGKRPSLGSAFMPIIIPLLLIVLASIAKYPTLPFGDNVFTTILLFIGSPVIALLIGAFLSFSLPEKFDAKLLASSGWVGESLAHCRPRDSDYRSGRRIWQDAAKLRHRRPGQCQHQCRFLGYLPAVPDGAGAQNRAGLLYGSAHHDGLDRRAAAGYPGPRQRSDAGFCGAVHRGRGHRHFPRQRQFLLGHDPAHGHEYQAGESDAQPGYPCAFRVGDSYYLCADGGGVAIL